MGEIKSPVIYPNSSARGIKQSRLKHHKIRVRKYFANTEEIQNADNKEPFVETG